MRDASGKSKSYVQGSSCGQKRALTTQQEHVPRGFSSENLCLEEHVAALNKFVHNKRQDHINFPPTLTSADRARLHEFCVKLKLNSMSSFQGSHTFMSVCRKEPKPLVVSCESANVLAVAAMQDEAYASQGFVFGVVVYDKQRVLVVTCHDEKSVLACAAHDFLPCRTEDVEIVDLEWHATFQAFVSHGRISEKGKYNGLQVFGIGGHYLKRIRACRIGLAICALWEGYFLEQQKHKVLMPLMPKAFVAFMGQPSAKLSSMCVQETTANAVSHSSSAANGQNNIHDKIKSRVVDKKGVATAAKIVPPPPPPAPLPTTPRVVPARFPSKKRLKISNGIGH